jgi:hyperpolarization activated cyclic nucleotide-gated potassium channel 2
MIHPPIYALPYLSSITSASCTELSEWCAIEYWITLICLYIGAIFYGILISAISAILQTANKSSQEFDDHLLRIDDYMRSKKLPASMREKMKDYFYLQFSNGKLHKEAEILDFLSPVLRREIKHFTGREICRKVPLLSTPSHSNFAQDISCVIEPAIVFANEVIMRESTTGDEMYFISSGVVEIFVSSIKNVAYLAIGDGCVSQDLAPFSIVVLSASFSHTVCCPTDETVLRRCCCLAGRQTNCLGKVQDAMHALSPPKEQSHLFIA